MRKVTTQYLDKSYLKEKQFGKDMRRAIASDLSWIKYMRRVNKRTNKRHFTKVAEFCSGCHKQLDIRDDYHRRYGFCDVYCGQITFGM